MLYQLLVSLPFVDDPEELDLKLKEVQRIKWGAQVENLRAFLKSLHSDQQLWGQAYRVTPRDEIRRKL